MPFCMACSRIFGVASPPVSIVGDAEVEDQAPSWTWTPDDLSSLTFAEFA